MHLKFSFAKLRQNGTNKTETHQRQPSPKAIITRTRLRNRFLKDFTQMNRPAYKKTKELLCFIKASK